MDAPEWLNLAKTENRIIKVTYRAFSPRRNKEFCFGEATACMVDETNRIAILLSDFGNLEETGLRAGDIVQLKRAHPEVDEHVIGSTATIRRDLPKIPFPDDRQPN